MIIYNITLSIHPDIEEQALIWLKETHIPEVMQTNLFLESNMYKVIESHIDKTHNSYAIQYKLENWDLFDIYVKNHAHALQQKTKDKFGDSMLAFRTFLEKIE